MEYQLTRFRLDHICELINGGQLALPDFQRDFVWPPSKVADLLQSISREWPIGSLLVLEGPSDFACKSIELGPDTYSQNVKFYILDGQQRITSVYHAIQDISDYVYYIDLKTLSNNSIEEDFILHSKRGKFEKEYKKIKDTALAGIIKIHDIYETEQFIEWLSFIENPDQRKEYAKIRRNFLYGINAGVYSIPATQLPRNVEFSALAKIFEGLNTNAVRLTTSDLLIAANLPKGINLKTMWNNFVNSLDANILEEFELLDLLKICVLIESHSNRYSGGIRQSELIKIPPEIYRKNWDEACRILEEAINYARKNLGVVNKSSLPSASNLIALGFVLQHKLSAEIVRCNWIHWILEETFSQSTHTRLITEISRKKTEWADRNITFISSKYKNEINTISERPIGPNAYLARGVISINFMAAIDEKILSEDQINDSSIINADTGNKPRPYDSIGMLKIATKDSKKFLTTIFSNKETVSYSRIIEIINNTKSE